MRFWSKISYLSLNSMVHEGRCGNFPTMVVNIEKSRVCWRESARRVQLPGNQAAVFYTGTSETEDKFELDVEAYLQPSNACCINARLTWTRDHHLDSLYIGPHWVAVIQSADNQSRNRCFTACEVTRRLMYADEISQADDGDSVN